MIDSPTVEDSVREPEPPEARSPSGLPRLGLGVYSYSEASRYARLHPSRLRAWFRGGAGGGTRQPILHSDYAPILGSSAIGFLELIEAFVVGRFRAVGVSMPRIRAAHRALAVEFVSVHPFAHGRFRTDGRSILAAPPQRDDDRVYFDPIGRNLWIPELLDGLERVDYSETSRLAERWRVSEGVVVDPAVAFGKPVAEATGTTTWVLARQFAANGRDAARVAALYGVDESSVIAAARFEEGLRAAA